jgi:hypothetical protein
MDALSDGRLSKGRPAAAALLVAATVAGSFTPAAAGKDVNPDWTWKSPDKVLWVVNASRAARTPPLTIAEPPPVAALLGVRPPSAVEEDFASGSLRVVETPCGVVVVVLRGEGKTVMLRAIDSLTGRARWEKTGFELGDSGGFLPIGNLLLAWSEEAGGGSRRPVLSALDVHDGRELWRTEAIAERKLRVLTLPGPGLALLRSDPSEGVHLYALDLATGAVRWQTSGASPARKPGKFDFDGLWRNARTLLLPAVRVPSSERPQEFWAEFPVYYQALENVLLYTQGGRDLFVVSLESHHHREPIVFALQRLDLETGRVLWEHRPALVLSMAVDPDRVYLWGPEKMVVLDRQSGQPAAEWPVEAARVNLSDPSAPRYVHVDGEVALLYRPSSSQERVPFSRPSKDAGLRVNDLRTGALLWQATLPGDDDRQLVLLGDSVLEASLGTVTVRDKRSGKVTASHRPKFAQPIASMSVTPDRQLLLQSVDQLAKLDPATWTEAFDTGPIPSAVPKASRADSILSTLLAGAVIAAAGSYGGTPAGVPPDVSQSYAAMRILQGAAAPSVDTRGVEASLSAAGVRARGSDHVLFAARGADGARLIRVDTRSGDKAPGAPFRWGKGVTTVVDDFFGASVELDGDTIRGFLYPLDEPARQAHRYADAYGWGIETLRRAEALRGRGDAAAAASEVAAGVARLEEALKLSSGPAEAIAVRLDLAEACARLGEGDAEAAAGWRARARRELETVVESGESDPSLRPAVEKAREALSRTRR